MIRNHIHRLLAALLVLVASAPAVHAQEGREPSSPDRIAGMGMQEGARVILRWGVASARGWHHGNEAGYIVERARLNERGVATEPFRPLTSAPLRPWTEQEWRARGAASSSYAAAAAGVLYTAPSYPEGMGEMQELRTRAADFSNRHGFALFAADNDSLAATGLALRFDDHDVERKTGYLYRVRVAQQPRDFTIDTAWILVEVDGPSLQPVAPALSYEPGDGTLTLKWEQNSRGISYSGYWMERSEDGGTTWKRLHTMPLLPVDNSMSDGTGVFVDTTVINYRRYRYRVRGVTPFATLSDGKEIEAMARDLTAPARPLLDSAGIGSDGAVHLLWSLEGGRVEGDLRGFRVGVSLEPEGPFEIDEAILLSFETRTARDVRAVGGANNYYTVIAEDTAGNRSTATSQYVHIPDATPPGRPVGVTATIDTTGRVQLRWRSNPEPDLLGYRVYWANNPTNVAVLRNDFPIADTSFVDSIDLNSLTRDAYYRVVALDRSFNPSDSSEMIHLSLPDLVAPTAPVFSSVIASDSAVQLAWIPSASSDVRGQTLYRREDGEERWQTVATLSRNDTAWIDRKVQQRTRYEYSLQAVDSAGLRSSLAFAVHARPYDPGVRRGVQNLRAVRNAAGGIEVQWDYPVSSSTQESYRFMIYRGLDALPPTQYASAENGEHLFRDSDAARRGRYTYAVRVMTSLGGESSLSDSVVVVVE